MVSLQRIIYYCLCMLWVSSCVPLPKDYYKLHYQGAEYEMAHRCYEIFDNKIKINKNGVVLSIYFSPNSTSLTSLVAKIEVPEGHELRFSDNDIIYAESDIVNQSVVLVSRDSNWKIKDSVKGKILLGYTKNVHTKIFSLFDMEHEEHNSITLYADFAEEKFGNKGIIVLPRIYIDNVPYDIKLPFTKETAIILGSLNC